VGLKALCPACAEAAGRQAAPPAFAGVAAAAPTAPPQPCANCRKETPAADLATVAGIQVCPACEHYLRHRPFPAWVKAAAAVVAALAIGGFVSNFRFIQGHVEAVRAGRAYAAGDIDTAADLMTAAAAHVPESTVHYQEALLLQGIQLLANEKTEEAVQRLRECSRYGSHKVCDFFRATAEAALAFDRKDYDKFLEHSRVLMKLHPQDDSAVAQVASALACQYAATGDPAFKAEAERVLAQAADLSHESQAGFDYYVRRIRHRLDTREILSREEFDRRFPDQAMKEDR
jgi:hypothetical protein